MLRELEKTMMVRYLVDGPMTLHFKATGEKYMSGAVLLSEKSPTFPSYIPITR
jgi:hypothetical protein